MLLAAAAWPLDTTQVSGRFRSRDRLFVWAPRGADNCDDSAERAEADGDVRDVESGWVAGDVDPVHHGAAA
jgi:hypothetical protein